MRIAIEGCTHGELEKTYQTIQQIEEQEGGKVDLLLCCGDFQSTRNLSDLACMACPDKYKSMCSFYKYYSGEAIAPVLTIFIGGNHEASNYLQELAYGGWVAPNIYYLGYAGVVQVNGVRIGGLSGIYKGFDYLHGHFEKPPYDDNSIRSAYHVRNVEVFRLKQLAGNSPDIMMSHDWPRSVYKHGNVEKLLRYKKHFREEVEQDRLGSPPAKDILDTLQPDFWFSAHLHCKFAAVVPHVETNKSTKFLALDKCLPRRQFLQVVTVGPPVTNDEVILRYCPAWLAVLKSTAHLLSVERKPRYTPGPGSAERWDFRPTEEEIEEIEKLFKNDFEIPYNFEQTALSYKPTGERLNMRQVPKPQATTNSQTTILCTKLGILDPMALLLGRGGAGLGGKGNVTLASWGAGGEVRKKVEEPADNIEHKVFKKDDEKDCEPIKKVAPLAIPAPKVNSSNDDFLAVLDTIGSESISDNKTTDDLFVIDKSSDTAEVDAGQDEAPEEPVKKLKRRNAALYATD
eukprot:TRINITY_DN67686_c0_g1_i1.p1 TRINITY_DN67686_c0_g1~~TRINITY_DN67686_c0_g1_i1.p1  ORF type:complete len:515 (-),score=189.89 TRINITY_DN67686_c0_g1_i1:56-1600(-)